MKYTPIIVGCMRFAEFTEKEMNKTLHGVVESGLNHFDHADIYGNGKSEEVFGKALANDKSLKREDLIIQSKCGIVSNVKYPHYDSSKEHIIESVNGSLKRLKTDFLDILLIHRPDALTQPEEIAEVFDILYKQGKVREFGVSNHKPMQIELLKKYINQPIVVNQMQFSIPVSNMIANGMEVNMTTEGSADRDGSVMDYCRINNITIQAWSPLQMPDWQGCFLGNKKYGQLNEVLEEIADKYSATPSIISLSWILRHPARMQIVTGSTKIDRIKDAVEAKKINLTREEWYRLYLAAGHILP